MPLDRLDLDRLWKIVSLLANWRNIFNETLTCILDPKAASDFLDKLNSKEDILNSISKNSELSEEGKLILLELLEKWEIKLEEIIIKLEEFIVIVANEVYEKLINNNLVDISEEDYSYFVYALENNLIKNCITYFLNLNEDIKKPMKKFVSTWVWNSINYDDLKEKYEKPLLMWEKLSNLLKHKNILWSYLEAKLSNKWSLKWSDLNIFKYILEKYPEYGNKIIKPTIEKQIIINANFLKDILLADYWNEKFPLQSDAIINNIGVFYDNIIDLAQCLVYCIENDLLDCDKEKLESAILLKILITQEQLIKKYTNSNILKEYLDKMFLNKNS